jgi:death-on-curing protein
VTEPVWLTRDVIISVQEELLARFGGLSGIRDAGLLDSALGRPQHLFTYEEPGLCELAASYAHGLVKNHPFLDGNKRIGFVAAYTFLGVNGLELSTSEEDAAIQTLRLAAGESTEKDYATWLEKGCGDID